MTDGWKTCARGHRHWGPYGAAGLLIRWDDRYLLQRRAWHVHHGGTWSTPGGARFPGEGPLAAARREATEEMGELPPLEFSRNITDDHGGWSYITCVADVAELFTPDLNRESAGHAWLTIPEALKLPLHPGVDAILYTEARRRAATAPTGRRNARVKRTASGGSGDR